MSGLIIWCGCSHKTRGQTDHVSKSCPGGSQEEILPVGVAALPPRARAVFPIRSLPLVSAGVGGLRPSAGVDPERNAEGKHRLWEGGEGGPLQAGAAGLRPPARLGGPPVRGQDRNRRKGIGTPPPGWLRHGTFLPPCSCSPDAGSVGCTKTGAT